MLRTHPSTLRGLAALVGALGLGLPTAAAGALAHAETQVPATSLSALSGDSAPSEGSAGWARLADSASRSSGGSIKKAKIYGISDLLLEFSRLHPDVVATISVDLGSLGSVARDLLAAREFDDDATLRLKVATARQSILGGYITTTTEELRVAVSEQTTARESEKQAQDDLTEIAVTTFVVVEEASLDKAGSGLEGNSLETIAEEAQLRLILGLEEAIRVRVAAEALVAAVHAELEDLQSQLKEQEAAAEVASEDQDLARGQIADLQPRFERTLMTTKLTGTDIPVVVFDAYYRAELRVAQEQPSCEVRWDHLAGIGKVESSHGSFGGNVVGVSGRTDGRILGPVLDGEPFAAISDTDGGRLDGDLAWDRAVGPMQFIPGSWSIYGRDGNGDGVKDPHNLYDAALAAGGHLCGTTGGLNQDANFQHALLGYNHSAPYGVLVMSHTDKYLAAVGPIVIAPLGLPESVIEPEFR